MKKSYEIITPLQLGAERIESGSVELDASEGDALVAIGALQPGIAIKAAAPAPSKSDKPLTEQSLEELQATARAEKVPGWGPIKNDQAKLLAAIEKKRAAAATGGN